MSKFGAFTEGFLGGLEKGGAARARNEENREMRDERLDRADARRATEDSREHQQVLSGIDLNRDIVQQQQPQELHGPPLPGQAQDSVKTETGPARFARERARALLDPNYERSQRTVEQIDRMAVRTMGMYATMAYQAQEKGDLKGELNALNGAAAIAGKDGYFTIKGGRIVDREGTEVNNDTFLFLQHYVKDETAGLEWYRASQREDAADKRAQAQSDQDVLESASRIETASEQLKINRAFQGLAADDQKIAQERLRMDMREFAIIRVPESIMNNQRTMAQIDELKVITALKNFELRQAGKREWKEADLQKWLDRRHDILIDRKHPLYKGKMGDQNRDSVATMADRIIINMEPGSTSADMAIQAAEEWIGIETGVVPFKDITILGGKDGEPPLLNGKPITPQMANAMQERLTQAIAEQTAAQEQAQQRQADEQGRGLAASGDPNRAFRAVAGGATVSAVVGTTKLALDQLVALKDAFDTLFVDPVQGKRAEGGFSATELPPTDDSGYNWPAGSRQHIQMNAPAGSGNPWTPE